MGVSLISNGLAEVQQWGNVSPEMLETLSCFDCGVPTLGIVFIITILVVAIGLFYQLYGNYIQKPKGKSSVSTDKGTLANRKVLE